MNSRKGKIHESRRARRLTITMIEPIGHEPESENSNTSEKKIQALYKKSNFVIILELGSA